MTVTMGRSAVRGAGALDLLVAEGVSAVSGSRRLMMASHQESKLTRQTAARTAR
jgi:hypothetical protein